MKEELESIQETQSLKGLAATATATAAAAVAAASGNGQIRYRSPSSAELVEGQSSSPPHPDHQLDKMLKRTRQQEPFADKIYRFRGVILVISVPLLLISFVLFLMPIRSPSEEYSLTHRKAFTNYHHSRGGGSPRSYAAIFDAGSSGSRVHVFCFDQHLDLVPIGKDLELFLQKKPGLSAYSSDPKLAADSLLSLLEKAESVVPQELRHKTPVRVGATAGLRALEGDASDRILEAVNLASYCITLSVLLLTHTYSFELPIPKVRDLLKDKSALKSEADWVTVLDGTQEGAFQWVTINYLLGNLGKKYSNTVGVVDLGGGSVQMAYAISEMDAAKAPRILDGEDTYVKEMYLKGTKYYLYVHSYLQYGLLAARAEILKIVEDSGNPCILVGYHGSYKYGGAVYEASTSPSGSNMNKCRRVAVKALKVNESTCTHMKCTFGGIWNGGGGDGQKNLFVASFFFDRAAEAGFVDPNLPIAKVRPVDFEDAAKRACETRLEDAKSTYPHVEEDNLPYLCMDLVYQFTLLVDGFDLDPWQEITLVKKVEYHNSLVEAAWPLGSAIDVLSSLT